jgi:hypothetical protein
VSTPEGRAARILLGGVVGSVALLLAACAGIPTSGPVRTGGGSANERVEPITRLIGQPPYPGIEPKDLVDGFLTASGAFDDDHGVAREYLTADARRGWDAGAGVTVYDGRSLTTADAGSNSVVVTASQVATISAQGVYEATVPAKPISRTFRLDKVAGEWRIRSLPFQGLMLDTDAVSRAYTSYDVYFLDPAASVVVPQPVLVPFGAGTTTSLVRALLEGPPAWLAPAVRTAVPAGTGLVVDSVPIVDGVAQVNLTSDAAAPVDSQAAGLSAQLVWTLRQIPEVAAVHITFQDVPLRGPGVAELQSRDDWATFDPDVPTNVDPVFVAKGRLQTLHDGRARAVAGPAGDGTLTLTHPALSLDGGQVAALTANGTALVVGDLGKDMRTSVTGTALTPPTWDRSGAVWTTDRTTGATYFVKPGGAVQTVTVNDRPAGSLTTLRIARDGVRAAAVVVGAGGHGQLYLARVERTEGTVALSGFRLVRDVADVVDVAWGTADRLVAYGTTATSQVAQPWIVDLSASTVTSLGSLPAGARVQSLTAGPTEPLLVSTVNGRLWRSGPEWEDLGDGAYPAYPG